MLAGDPAPSTETCTRLQPITLTNRKSGTDHLKPMPLRCSGEYVLLVLRERFERTEEGGCKYEAQRGTRIVRAPSAEKDALARETRASREVKTTSHS